MVRPSRNIDQRLLAARRELLPDTGCSGLSQRHALSDQALTCRIERALRGLSPVACRQAGLVKRIAPASALLICLLLSACERKPDDAYIGYAEADYVRLSSPLAGTVTRLYLVRGAQAAAQAPAFVLEQQSEAAARQEAGFRVARAQEQLSNLKLGRRSDELAALQAQQAQAQAALALSESELARTTRLVNDKFVSPAGLDQAHAAVNRDQARANEIAAQLRLATKGSRNNEINAAAEEVKAAQAQAEQAQWRLEQKTQRTPVAGEVVDVLYREGEFVPAGMPVVTLLPPQNIKARFFVPQQALAQISLGKPVELRCDGCDAAIPAQVSFIASSAEYTAPLIYSRENRANLVFMVEALPSPTDARRLHPGQPLEVRLAAPPKAAP